MFNLFNKKEEKSKEKQQYLFLFEYQLNKRTSYCLVKEESEEKAKQKLIDQKTYLHSDALITQTFVPEEIRCLNLE